MKNINFLERMMKVPKDCLLISESVIEKCLDIEKAICISEQTLHEQGESNVLMPPKLLLDLKKAGVESYSNAAPAYIKHLKIAGIKWGGGFTANTETGCLPYMVQTVILIDPFTGIQKAILSGIKITAAKTGCETAVACKYLAPRGASIAAIIGVGEQGVGTIITLLALCRMGILQLQEVRLFDLIKQKSINAAKKFNSPEVEVFSTNSVEEAVKGADIIITATTATKPFLKKEWVKAGVFIAGLGSFAEIEEELVVTADKLVVDDWEENNNRGQFVNLITSGNLNKNDCSTLPQIVCGRNSKRRDNKEIIIGSLIGLGSIDICIAHTIYEEAKNLELGFKFNFMS